MTLRKQSAAKRGAAGGGRCWGAGQCPRTAGRRWMMRENQRVARQYKQQERDRISKLVSPRLTFLRGAQDFLALAFAEL